MINAARPIAFSAAALLLGLSACSGSSKPPRDIDNACSFVEERPDWYKAARKAAKKWQAPTPVILAIIWRESQFQADAQTPRKYALGVVPWGRQSSAYGFAQAIDGTWEWYQDDQNAHGADRDDFADAADFVGWYMDKTRKTLKIPTQDARAQYLAYHEGHGGYRTGKWRNKAFLVRASKQVERMTRLYDSQLRTCDAQYARESALGIARSPLPTQPPFALSNVPGQRPIAKPAQPEMIPAKSRSKPIPKPKLKATAPTELP
jgi:hypothetical protein